MTGNEYQKLAVRDRMPARKNSDKPDLLEFCKSKLSARHPEGLDIEKQITRLDRRANMLDANSCCGTCEYSTYDKVNGYVCVNDESDYVADFVEFNHVCDEWEGKRQ